MARLTTRMKIAIAAGVVALAAGVVIVRREEPKASMSAQFVRWVDKEPAGWWKRDTAILLVTNHTGATLWCQPMLVKSAMRVHFLKPRTSCEMEAFAFSGTNAGLSDAITLWQPSGMSRRRKAIVVVAGIALIAVCAWCLYLSRPVIVVTETTLLWESEYDAARQSTIAPGPGRPLGQLADPKPLKRWRTNYDLPPKPKPSP